MCEGSKSPRYDSIAYYEITYLSIGVECNQAYDWFCPMLIWTCRIENNLNSNAVAVALVDCWLEACSFDNRTKKGSDLPGIYRSCGDCLLSNDETVVWMR